ncbi:MAG TPA: amidophosphoribosyltransferase [Spirochaetota bacterium]|nr:amidophosphoribosyltransferase [Spirochaetota bacterium]HOM38727.1 amidophosphoribosyltransferase [Spirochaetota bacterium]HPQ49524.1 amidophosphoribosyltransferase [Spirochaetota bacterium]
MDSRINEKCGIFGIYNNSESARITYLGLYSLQHRGQESCGIATSDGNRIYKSVGMGKVIDFFTEDKISKLIGNISIGHVRYSTTGESNPLNAQPLVANYNRGYIAVAHNGNITNAMKIRLELEKEGAIFQSTSDTEVIIHLIARSKKKNFNDALLESLALLEGAFCFVILRENSLIAVRDPWGFRPLSLGFKDNSYVIASETTAFDVIDADYVRDIEPGEVIVIENNRITSLFIPRNEKKSCCVFELIYFAKPSSIVFNHSVYSFREELGRQLAIEDDITPDIVIPVPDSGRMAALGYSSQKNVPLGEGLIRSHYIGRTFIEPSQGIRDFGVKIKFSPVKDLLKNKRIVVIDDSIVRGTTARKIIRMIKNVGAKEIHFRISSPPTISPCFFGIDFPTKEELLANKMSLPEIEKYLGVNSLKYISYDGMISCLKDKGFCTACFDGKYPVKVENFSKNIMTDR